MKQPIGKHRDDTVKCSDGTIVNIMEAFEDCEGNYHSNEEDRHDANVEIVTDLLMDHDKWMQEYCTENTDFPSSYSYCVLEDRYNWKGSIRRWLENDYEEYGDDLVNYLCENIMEWDFDPEYGGCEYSAYRGSGCYLWGFAIEEQENQIEINASPELSKLHDEGRLDDVLNDVNCDVYVDKTGDTHVYGSRCPHIMTIHSVPGRWDFVVPLERMRELIKEYQEFLDADGS